MPNERKIFFKSEAERNLWIKLNAERIQYSNQVLNNVDEDLGDVNKQYSPMWVSNNQLEYDEHMRDVPRFSFEELLMLDSKELFRLAEHRNREKIKELFAKL